MQEGLSGVEDVIHKLRDAGEWEQALAALHETLRAAAVRVRLGRAPRHVSLEMGENQRWYQRYAAALGITSSESRVELQPRVDEQTAAIYRTALLNPLSQLTSTRSHEGSSTRSGQSTCRMNEASARKAGGDQR